MSQDSDDLFKIVAILGIGKIIGDRIQGLMNQIGILHSRLIASENEKEMIRRTKDMEIAQLKDQITKLIEKSK